MACTIISCGLLVLQHNYVQQLSSQNNLSRFSNQGRPKTFYYIIYQQQVVVNISKCEQIDLNYYSLGKIESQWVIILVLTVPFVVVRVVC